MNCIPRLGCSSFFFHPISFGKVKYGNLTRLFHEKNTLISERLHSTRESLVSLENECFATKGNVLYNTGQRAIFISYGAGAYEVVRGDPLQDIFLESERSPESARQPLHRAAYCAMQVWSWFRRASTGSAPI